MPGLQELIVIAVVALLVFGPDRLPELARTAGKWLGRFRAETQRNVDEIKRMGEIQELQEELRGLRREMDGTRRSFQGQLRDVGGTPAAPGTPIRSRDVPRDLRGSQAGGSLRPDDQPAPSDPDAT